MVVDITNSLSSNLINSGACGKYLIKQFTKWKTNWDKYEYCVYDFGKNSGLISPKLNGNSYELKHVHLCPTDPIDLAKWNKIYKRGLKYNSDGGSKRTSNRILIYAENNQHYLLIAILPEPTAHNILKMKNIQDEKVMKYFAFIAEQYINNGKIVN